MLNFYFSIFNLMGCLFLIISLIVFNEFMIMFQEGLVYFIEWNFFFLNSVNFSFSVILDIYSVSFLFFLLVISSAIMFYSFYYMKEDLNYLRFFIVLFMFILSMMILIFSVNLVSIILGWDGLGITSYLLVVYYQNESSANCGMITVLSNRVGDCFFLVVVGMSFYLSSYNFNFFNETDKIIILLLMLASLTKSAQTPFSAWLPAAMAAPTPVSSLVHSSTLVTAGVYLMIRWSIFNFYDNIFILLVMTGMTTLVMSSWMANFENDLKKIIALSTLSQLGVMMVIIGLDEPLLAFFHMIMHAIFKSTLFMCSGFVIHNLSGSQDSRILTFTGMSSPIMSMFFMSANMALMGFPFLSGFYSKDMIFESEFSNFFNVFLLFMYFMSIGLTIFYSLRLIFLSSGQLIKLSTLNLSADFNMNMVMSLTIMFILINMSGFYFSWYLIFYGVVTMLSTFTKFFIVLSLILSFFFTLVLNISMSKNSVLSNKMFWFYCSMYYINFLSKKFLSMNMYNYSVLNYKNMDKGWLEFMIPNSIFMNFLFSSKYMQLGVLTKMMLKLSILIIMLMMLL